MYFEYLDKGAVNHPRLLLELRRSFHGNRSKSGSVDSMTTTSRMVPLRVSANFYDHVAPKCCSRAVIRRGMSTTMGLNGGSGLRCFHRADELCH